MKPGGLTACISCTLAGCLSGYPERDDADCTRYVPDRRRPW
jgi:hypothetical protein